MDEKLKDSLDLFIENHVAIQNKYPGSGAISDAVAALEYTAQGKHADIDRMQEAAKVIDKELGKFKILSGAAHLMMITQVAQAEDMESYFAHVQSVYEMIKPGRWSTNEHYFIAAMLVAQHSNCDDAVAKQYVEKAQAIYGQMKENHPWLTNAEDMGFATLLAVSGLEEEAAVTEMEKCFDRLKAAKIGSANGIQSLSHVLALHVGDAAEKCDKVIAIDEALKSRKKNLGSSFELSILGSLAFVDEDSEVLAQEIADADDYLKSAKGPIKALTLNKKQRLMYATIFVVQLHSGVHSAEEATTVAGAISVIIAMQIAMLMVINANMMAMNAMR